MSDLTIDDILSDPPVGARVRLGATFLFAAHATVIDYIEHWGKRQALVRTDGGTELSVSPGDLIPIRDGNRRVIIVEP